MTDLIGLARPYDRIYLLAISNTGLPILILNGVLELKIGCLGGMTQEEVVRNFVYASRRAVIWASLVEGACVVLQSDVGSHTSHSGVLYECSHR